MSRQIRSEGYNRNFGDESEWYLLFGRNNDDNLNQRNEIKELNGQIAILIEKVQHLHRSIKASDGFKDSPFVNLKWSRLDYTWDDNINDELPEYYGSCNPDEFVDWLNTIEKVLEYYDVFEARKVKLVSKSLRGRALDWWKQLQLNRQTKGNGKIKSWEKTKKKFKEQFLPFHYNDLLDLN